MAEVGAGFVISGGPDKWNLIGIRATINTFDPWIACQNHTDSTVDAFSQCHANLSRDVDQSAQIGWVKRRRSDGSVGIDIFVEFRDAFLPAARYVTYLPGPMAGQTWTYVLQLDINTGHWTAYVTYPSGTLYFNLNSFNSLYSAYYTGRKYIGASWQGETADIASYMPGFSGNRCQFSSCQYLTSDSASWNGVGYTSLSYIPASGTSTNSQANIPFFGSVNVEVWDTRSPHP